MAATAPSDPRTTDGTPRVSIWIDGEEQLFVEEYSIDNDVLSIGDPFRLKVPNIDGEIANKYQPGALCKVFMSDATAENNGTVTRLIGRVTTLDYTCDAQGGSSLSIGGQDLGWHLQECHAPYFKQIPGGITFADLVDRTVGQANLSAWGFAGVAFDNQHNVRINQGRAGVERRLARAAGGEKVFVAPLQIEPGQAAAEFLVEFARRDKRFVNVSSDGYIQFYQPNDDGPAQYRLRLYKSSSKDRNKGNVKSAKVTCKIDGLYSVVKCVGTSVLLKDFVAANTQSPNRGRFSGTYTPPSNPLPFPRLFSFADGDQLNKQMVNDRAEWKARRGRFDSFSATYTVQGHTQNGLYWTPDTCVDVLDEVNGLSGKYYISAVQYNRTMREGTTTNITVREAGQLSA